MVELVDIDNGDSKWDDYNKSILEASGFNVHMKCGRDNVKNEDTKDDTNNKKRKGGKSNHNLLSKIVYHLRFSVELDSVI